jgi:PKD repeat protein
MEKMGYLYSRNNTLKMKKQILTILAAIATTYAVAQTIPNGGFESWTTVAFKDPDFMGCSNDETHGGGYSPYNAFKTTDAYHGSFAIKLTTMTNGVDTAGGYFAYGNPGDSIPTGGLPINQTPTGIRFYQKYNFIPGDTGLVLVVFKKAGAVIGQYVYKNAGVQSNYTLFQQTFSPALTQTPDTVVFAATSCNFMNNAKIFLPGSTVTIDSISFTGISPQPLDMNGDFELWHPVTRDNLNGWNGRGAIKTTDKYSGSLALELITVPPGFGSGQIEAGEVSNTINRNCHNCSPSGGSPYTTQVDTLVFYYKYLPANFPSYTDSAEVNMSFSKNGVWIDGRGARLAPAISGFQKIEIPFNLTTIPDTVQISARSSKYPYQNSYVGSDLIIDQIYFKSQKVPVSSFSMPLSGCKGVPIQLTDNSSNGPTQWLWITTGSSPSNSSTQQNPVVTYTNTGTFNVSLQAKDSFGTAPFLTKTIVIYANPVVTASSATVCASTGTSITASGATTYTWNTGATGATLVVSPSVSTTYTVVGTNTVGCSAASTGSIFVPMPASPDICMVSSDSASLNNIIYWDKTPYTNVDSFIVYREVSNTVYKRIGAQHQSAFSTFTDTVRSVGPANGDPNVGSYRYKLQILDTCGNYGPLGKYHNTVYISTNHAGAYNWNLYLVEGSAGTPVSTFDLYRDDINDGTWHAIGFVSGNQFSLNDPSFSSYPLANWRVNANGFSCNPTYRYGNNGTQAAIVKSKSNISNNRGTSIAKNNVVLGVYPNPSNGVFTIALSTAKATADVYDLTGKKAASFNLQSTTSEIDLSNLSNGSYILNIITEKGTYHEKINKTN